ncbi:hypothetical protein HFQ13_08400 [Acidithiobacillus sp. VAN18-1]|uniref:Uncharacterized protein n=1 Tax=Igneacidithiobacillus copahuensis TaxID=2724909 RepID=A0AAE2YQ07_9PROT|nr:hypothetical protein [Igneacidithiobacillus copahuensis]MBU2788222.1 hypothetical protein [Igneacidithiobacillus copahuensis]MBU2797098.1 hypothetical protein [Acidithiobacillus sp. VAN18-2]
MPVRMMQRNNLANAFVAVNDGPTNAALAAAKAEVGEAAWKQGHTEETEKATRAAFKAHGARYETEISGKLTGIALAETQANGEKFQKLRVTLEQGADKTILSEDIGSEFAQRLIAKLDRASQEHAGQTVTIGGFAEFVTKEDGRTFTNHVATLKDAQKQEITAIPGHFEQAQMRIGQAQTPMIAAGMGDNKKVLSQIADSARAAYFVEVVQTMTERLKEQGIAPKQVYPRLEGHQKDEQGTWRSVGLYVDDHGKTRGVLALENREQGIKERHSVEFVERTSKSGIPMLAASVTREDGSKLYANVLPHENRTTGEKFLSASFGERDPQGTFRQIEGQGGGLKPNEAMKQLGDQDRTAQMIREKFGVDVLTKSRDQAQGVER